jgi:MFS family permease
MATRLEGNTVYAAGLVQGIVLVTFPAASTIFTDPAQYDLSNTQYGTMFVPQVITAITASLLAGGLARRIGSKRAFLLGLLADLASMVLLLVSTLAMGNGALAYGLLLAATACLGVGFGLTVPSINTFAAVFHPDRVDNSVLVLNALLGAGTALAPLFVAIFVGLGFWWGLPLTSVVLIVALIGVSLRLPLRAGARESGAEPRARGRIPRQFWMFAGFAVLYGMCETMNGNWAQVDMTKNVGASATQASLALTAFWAMVTVGRVLFAEIQRSFPTRRAYHVLPFVLAAALLAVAALPADSPWLGVVAFGIAGLGCSALLPLTISFSQEQLVVMSGSVAGAVIAFYQVGYGLAAFGAGGLQDHGVSLSTLYTATAIAGVVMGLLSFALATNNRDVAGARKRPTHAASPHEGG